MEKTIDECFFQIQNGANIKQGDADGGFPITRIETTANDKFNRDRMGYAGITDISKYESYVLEDGDLLMSHINSVQYLGRTVLYVKQPNETIIHGMNLLRLKARRDVINPAYARYCFYGHPFRSQVGNITKKSVNQASFAVKDLKQIKIDVPSLDEQNKIVEVLDKLQKVIEMRTNELLELDDLIKARFVELFGERLEKETIKLSTLTDVITKGTTPTTLGFEFTKKGINFVKIECITEDSKFIISKMLHISEECNQKLKRSILQEDDVLFSIAGAIGRTAIVTKEVLPANTNQAVAIIRLKPNCGLNVNFLNQMLQSSLIEKQVNVKKAGVAQVNLSLADIGDFNVIVPPIEEQEQFAAFVKQTDKSKAVVQKSLDETQLLFDSLMQEYFG